MKTITESPLTMLVQQGLQEIGACPVDPALSGAPEAPSETVAQIAGGLLVSMGIGEIAQDLDLEAIALLGAASVDGLKAIGEAEPGVHRLEDAVRALEDLLRRTAPGRS